MKRKIVWLVVSCLMALSTCYYYGCRNINEIKADQCDDIFGKCKGLCSFYYYGGKKECKSCSEIKECKDYTRYIAGSDYAKKISEIFRA